MAYQPKSYRKFVATAATATLVATAVTPAFAADKSFGDVSERYKEAVDYLVKNNITEGISETQFGIDQKIKRVDFAVMLAKAIFTPEQIENAKPSKFTDVPSRGVKQVNALKEAGIVNGKTDTRFGANDEITRGEAALMLAEAYKLKGDAANLKFTDVSDRYKDAVAGLVAHEITSGKSPSQFGTTDPIKRGEFAIFLYKCENPVKAVAPAIESVKAMNSKQATVTFKGAVKQGVDFTNFDIDGGLTVSDVKFATDRKSAVITVSSEFTRNQEYTVSLFGVKDDNGNEYPETKGKFTWEVAEGITVALDSTTLEQKQSVGLTVKDASGKDVKDATIEIVSYNENIVKVTGNTPSEVKVTAQDLAGTADVVVKTTLPDGTVMTNTFKVTVKEAVNSVTNSGFSLQSLTGTEKDFANTAAFKAFAKPTTSLVEGSGATKLIAFGETNGNPDTTHIDFTDATRVVSSNPIVATAVKAGSEVNVTPLTPGTTTVTVTMKDGSRKSFPITVTAKPELKTIKVSDTTINLSDENRTEKAATAADANKDGQEGVDAKTFTVTGLDQFDKEHAFGSAGKVTVSANTEGVSLYQDATELTAGSNELVLNANDKMANVKVVAKRDTPVKNAKITVNYFAKKSDAKPTSTKTITLNVADIDPELKTSTIDVVSPSEIDANSHKVTGAVSNIDFTATPVYALDSKGNRLEKLNDVSAELAEKDADNKFVEASTNKVQFKSLSDALTFLRASNTVDVEVTADGVTKVLPITYKNTAVVPNKATVATNAVSIKLADGVQNISLEDIIFGQADKEQLILDKADSSLLTDKDGDNIIGVSKIAKNSGYKYNKPLVTITGTDGKAMATGVNVYGGVSTDFSANTWNNAIVNELSGYTTTTFTSSDFEVDFMIANVNDSATISGDTVTDTVTPAAGKATTFTLVIKGIYAKDSVKNIEGTNPTAAEKAAHNLLASPVQLNVSVSK